MTSKPRTLVVVIGTTRAAELTGDAFSANVLDTLDADLALASKAGEPPNVFHERAKYDWTHVESGDWVSDYDRAVGSTDWRVLFDLPGSLMGRIDDPADTWISSGLIILFYRRLLWQSLLRDGLVDAYDWFVLTRSDLLWPLPHPPVSSLSNRRIWVLDGEHYGGIEDRHVIVPRRYIQLYGEMMEPIFNDPEGLYRRLRHSMAEQAWGFFNPERFIACAMREAGLWGKIGYLPYIPYLVRAPGGPTNWSVGEFDQELGCYVKYPTERQRSEIAAEFVHDRDSWRRYLSLCGALDRHMLKSAYRRAGLYERAFTRREWALRKSRRARARLAGMKRSLLATRRRVVAWVGAQLRKVPGVPGILDARLERIRRRARADLLPSPPVTGAIDFDDYADSYRQAVEESIAFQGANHEFFTRAKVRRLLELAADRLGPPGELAALDVGCGTGETDHQLKGRFRELAGVDVSPKLLEVAARANPWAEYRPYAEGDPIPFEDGAFDLSFAICVLHHVPVPDREGFIAEMARVTRPGGVVAIFEHNPWNPLTRRTVNSCEFDEGVVLSSRRRTRRLMCEQGLELLQAPYIVFFTRDGGLRRRAERGLARVPAGAQYYAAARKPSTGGDPA